jgi:hypothetical protein
VVGSLSDLEAVVLCCVVLVMVLVLESEGLRECLPWLWCLINCYVLGDVVVARQV